MKRTSVHTKNMSMSVIFICTSYQVWLSIISDLDSRLSGHPNINLTLIRGITKEKGEKLSATTYSRIRSTCAVLNAVQTANF